MIAALVEFVFDVKGRRDSDITQHASDAATHELLGETQTELQNTNGLVDATRSMVGNFSLLMPQIASLTAHVSALDTKIAATHDPRLIRELTQQATAAKTELANAYKEAFIPLVNDLTERMADARDSHKFQLENLGNYKEEERYRHLSPEQLTEREAFWNNKIEQDNAEFNRELLSLIDDANSLRRALLQHIPASEYSDEDKAEATAFTSARLNPDGFDVGKATLYLRTLEKRLSQ